MRHVNNKTDGFEFYCTCDASGRNWFAEQWKRWPERVDQENTTNIMFLYGGVLAYRGEHGRDPVMSDDYSVHVASLDHFMSTPTHRKGE